MKIFVMIGLLVVAVFIYCMLLPPRILECDVGMDGLVIRLERNLLSWNYKVNVNADERVIAAAGLPESAEIPQELVGSAQTILAQVGVPGDRRIGSRKFREEYCISVKK